MQTTLDVIENLWDGPFQVDHVVSNMHGPADYGLYQVYGTHNVFGSDSLLYIGRAKKRPFGRRLAEHAADWIPWVSSAVELYLGRLGGVSRLDADGWPVWEERIERSECLLNYFCAPPYNGSGLKTLREMDPTVVLNQGRSHRLPLEISTLLATTQIGASEWKAFGSDLSSAL